VNVVRLVHQNLSAVMFWMQQVLSSYDSIYTALGLNLGNELNSYLGNISRPCILPSTVRLPIQHM